MYVSLTVCEVPVCSSVCLYVCLCNCVFALFVFYVVCVRFSSVFCLRVSCMVVCIGLYVSLTECGHPVCLLVCLNVRLFDCLLVCLAC